MGKAAQERNVFFGTFLLGRNGDPVYPQINDDTEKKEVFLRTFSVENGDPDGSISVAGTALVTTWSDWVEEGYFYRLSELWRSPCAIERALNNVEESPFAYTIKAGDESNVMSTFFTCILPKIRDEVKQNFLDDGGPKKQFVVENYNRLLDRCPKSETDAGIWLGMINIHNPKPPYRLWNWNWCDTTEGSTFKKFLKNYADLVDASVSSLVFECLTGGKIFLSDLGRKTPAECGMIGGDLILVSPRAPVYALRAPLKVLHENSQPKRSKGKRKNKSKRRAKKTAPPEKTTEEMEEEQLRRDRRTWMDNIARVHAEAETLFKKKREKLHAVNLDRTAPKKRKAVMKRATESPPVDNPPGIEEGKAGKSHFIIRVGEEENLYKSSKSFSGKNVKPLFSVPALDLHGYTKEQAMSKLDECLPKWVDTAMKGGYPWVIQVKIICGGGNQILSEAVKTWIRQNKKVSNAPKSRHA